MYNVLCCECVGAVYSHSDLKLAVLQIRTPIIQVSAKWCAFIDTGLLFVQVYNLVVDQYGVFDG